MTTPTMTWIKSEYLLKGLFLGLVLFAALDQGLNPPPSRWHTIVPINLATLAGLAIALLTAMFLRLRQGYQLHGRPVPFLLFLLLESPLLIYAGILGGLLIGLFGTDLLLQRETPQELMMYCAGGGVLLGLLFCGLAQIRELYTRVTGSMVLALLMTMSILYWYSLQPDLKDPVLFAMQLLLGIPFFYLLTFSGREEETEVEIGSISALLAVGLWFLTREQPMYQGFGYLAPPLLYLIYALYILPWLRVVKHAFRGMSYARVNQHRLALLAFRRALVLDPNNSIAREGFWHAHTEIDLSQLADKPELLALLDFNLCLERAGSLLVRGKPAPAKMDEARRLMQLVLSQRPDLQPAVDYWQAVALLHERKVDEAAALLQRLLDPAHYGADNEARRSVLMQAWQLVLTGHEEMRQRVGLPELARPGRRIEAISAVEKALTATPQDEWTWNLKRLLYQDLTEAEYQKAKERPAAPEGGLLFDYRFVQQLGMELLSDGQRWQRGGEYLKMAADGMPTLGPTLFVEIAKAQQRAGQDQDALHNFEMAKRTGRAAGVRNLAESERKAYFATVKYLGEYALYQGDVDAALENYRLFTESENAGIETYRTLAELYEKKGDALSAARATDQGLLYSYKDRDLLEKKDRYYYSILPEDLTARLETVRQGFDVAYCLKKAKAILDGPANDLEWLDVAAHLLQLANIVAPESMGVRVHLARLKLRYGERDEAIAILEAIRATPPGSFSGDEEEAWHIAHQMLGDLYMEVNKPEQAVACYNVFRKSVRSGAKTYFKMGQAYEQLGDVVRAVKCYKQVTAYEGNPLTSDAYMAIHRLQANAS